MEQIKNLREEIDQIDSELVSLLFKRLELAKDVASSKIKTNTAVLNNQREEEVIAKAVSVSGDNAKQISTLMKAIMRISREKQYEIISENDKYWSLKKLIESAKSAKIKDKKIVYCGKSGSYSEKAASIMFPSAKPKGQKSFERACELVATGEADIAVLPLENSTAGTVNEVYDLIPQYGLYIVGALSSGIEHSLMAVKGTKLTDIKEIISHPQALMQCDKLIKEMDVIATSCDNTAFAAEMVSKRKDKTIAAIASEQSAVHFNLEILKSNINDEESNQTRFVALSKNPTICENADRLSIAFRLPHESGALANVLSIFADLALNLVKIQSRPIPHMPWEYMFYLDFSAIIENKDALRALYHLEKELPFMAFLGWYKEDN